MWGAICKCSYSFKVYPDMRISGSFTPPGGLLRSMQIWGENNWVLCAGGSTNCQGWHNHPHRLQARLPHTSPVQYTYSKNWHSTTLYCGPSPPLTQPSSGHSVSCQLMTLMMEIIRYPYLRREGSLWSTTKWNPIDHWWGSPLGKYHNLGAVVKGALSIFHGTTGGIIVQPYGRYYLP